MNATAEHQTAHERVLIDLAHSRGLEGLDELRDRLKAEGHDRVARTLLKWPPVGWGRALDEILALSEEEKERISKAFGRTFLNPRRATES